MDGPGLVILDRDGVINRDRSDFVKSPEEWVALPGSLEAIALLARAGFTVAVATNQSGWGVVCLIAKRSRPCTRK